ncbi:hypothetical protein GCM10020295_19730 [Streptomyces cinereospinus]
MPTGIFVNYRVGDCETEAALLHRLLADRFGDEQVFFASSSIQLSADFTEAIPEGLARSSVLIAVIGPEWLTVTDAHGTSRIQLAEDWVRRELAYAFQHDISVVPVLVDRGRRIRMPSAAELPDDLARLERCQYLRMHYQSLRLERLFAELAELTPQTFAHRVLLPAEELPPEPVPSMLLRAEYGVVPFHGRETEQEEFHAWCAGPAGSAVRLVTGPGGQGKTRLALHLCRQAAERGWLAGFVDESCAPDDLAVLARCTAPMLLVLDYAEARAEQLLVLAAECVRRDADAGPLRLLLLSRAGGEWQRPLAEYADDRVAVLFAAMPEHRLAPLVPSEAQRQAEFVGAAREFSAHLAGTRPEAAVIPADLGTARYDRILDVHAAAMVALLEQDEPPDSAPSTSASASASADPVARVLAHERRYWRRLLAVHGLPEDTSLHADALVAVATLFGAGTEEGALALLSGTPHLRGRVRVVPAPPSALGLGRPPRWPRTAPPAPRPARRGTRLARPGLLPRGGHRPPGGAGRRPGPPGSDRPRPRRRAPPGRRPRRRRAARPRHRPHAPPLGMEVAPQLENPRAFARTLLDSLQAHDDDHTVGLVLGHLPDESVALADLAVLASELTLSSAKRHASVNPATTARLLLRYTYHLKTSGRRREAREAAEEAAGLFEQLVADSRQTHLADLGRALHGLAVMLDETGERDRGLSTIRRAVEVRRELCGQSDVHLPELALSLDVLGADLAERGHRAEALAAGQEAVQIFEELAAARPVLYEAQLATALGNLALQWERFGDFDGACAASERCVAVLRRLSDQNPDAHLLKYAEALNHQASALVRAGRPAVALAPPWWRRWSCCAASSRRIRAVPRTPPIPASGWLRHSSTCRSCRLRTVSTPRRWPPRWRRCRPTAPPGRDPARRLPAAPGCGAHHAGRQARRGRQHQGGTGGGGRGGPYPPVRPGGPPGGPRARVGQSRGAARAGETVGLRRADRRRRPGGLPLARGSRRAGACRVAGGGAAHPRGGGESCRRGHRSNDRGHRRLRRAAASAGRGARGPLRSGPDQCPVRPGDPARTGRPP